MNIDQSTVLYGEPILLTVEAPDGTNLPWYANPETDVWFEIEGPIAPVEPDEPTAVDSSSYRAGNAAVYNVLDYYWYTEEYAGDIEITVNAEIDGDNLVSEPISVTVEEPAADDDIDALDRLHHFPWINYLPDRYCGDTFDLVDEWPESAFAPYSHFYSGRHLQFEGKLDAAIGSFETVLECPSFALTPEAAYHIAESYRELGQHAEAETWYDRILDEWPDSPAAQEVDAQVTEPSA